MAFMARIPNNLCNLGKSQTRKIAAPIVFFISAIHCKISPSLPTLAVTLLII